jgi:hypothetical protein
LQSVECEKGYFYFLIASRSILIQESQSNADPWWILSYLLSHINNALTTAYWVKSLSEDGIFNKIFADENLGSENISDRRQ